MNSYNKDKNEKNWSVLSQHHTGGSIRVGFPNQFCLTLGPSSPPASQEMVLV